MAITQQARMAKVSSPLGPNVLVLDRLDGHEELGRLFDYELSLVSENYAIKLDALLGKPMGVSLELPDGSQRYFHGIACRCSQTAGTGQFAGYQISLRPWFWLLSRTSDCRIFQNKTVPDIIKQVFRDLGFSDFEDSLSRSYREWEYCVQYRETSFEFVSRLMEQEGIYYYFRHEKERHVLVLSDAYGAHKSVADYASVPYYPLEDQMRERDHIYDWHLAREVQPGSLALNDYDFQRPSARLEVRSTRLPPHSNAEHPLYDYPGEYVQSKDGEQYARNRIEAIQTQYERVHLRTNARGLGSGHLFKMTGYPRDDQNREYLIVGARYSISQESYESGATGGVLQYESALDCIEASQAFRPMPTTIKPIVQGPQTAMVVGPKGEIWTDQYGRVKVHFYWDRHDQSNENSSCWMRVSQAWAGKNWGHIQIPRIGQEVIVSFLEGDPDRPIITGRVYNAEQTVPYELPANATQSGTKSRSSKAARRRTSTDPHGGQEGRGTALHPRGEEPGHRGRERRDPLGRPRPHQDHRPRRDGAREARPHRDRGQQRDHHHRRRPHREGRQQREDHHRRQPHRGRRQQRTITIGANRTEKVGSNENITIGSNRTESVGSNEHHHRQQPHRKRGQQREHHHRRRPHRERGGQRAGGHRQQPDHQHRQERVAQHRPEPQHRRRPERQRRHRQELLAQRRRLHQPGHRLRQHHHEEGRHHRHPWQEHHHRRLRRDQHQGQQQRRGQGQKILQN